MLLVAGALGVGFPPLSAQSSFKQVRVESCAVADSVLGPVAGDQDAVVRLHYFASVDTTRLVAGLERTHSIDPDGSDVLFMTSYGGHHPTVYPHLDLFFVLRGAPTLVGAPGDSSPVVLLVDGSAIPIGSVIVPAGSAFSFHMTLTRNQAFLLAGATTASFTIYHLSHAVTREELRDIRGMYRVALCGQSTAEAEGESTPRVANLAGYWRLSGPTVPGRLVATFTQDGNQLRVNIVAKDQCGRDLLTVDLTLLGEVDADTVRFWSGSRSFEGNLGNACALYAEFQEKVKFEGVLTADGKRFEGRYDDTGLPTHVWRFSR